MNSIQKTVTMMAGIVFIFIIAMFGIAKTHPDIPVTLKVGQLYEYGFLTIIRSDSGYVIIDRNHDAKIVK